MPVQPLVIKLLGDFAVVDGVTRRDIRSRKSRALLAYLAVHAEKAIARDRLAALLWSDTETQFGRTNLRQTLSTLKKSIGDAADSVIKTDRDVVLLVGQVCDIDVVELRRGIESERSPDDLIRLYRGELLHDFPAIDPAFDEWAVRERELLCNDYAGALRNHLKIHNTQAVTDPAMDWACSLLQILPSDELAHRVLMKGYFERGERQAALVQYRACEDSLRTELEVEPSAETQQLRDRIRDAGQTSAGEISDSAVFTDIASPSTAAAQNPVSRGNRRRYLDFSVVSAALMVALVVIVVLAVYQGSTVPTGTSTNPMLDAQTLVESANPAEDRKLSLAVLPLTNLADASEQYFSDGLSEDLITDISRISGLRVVASDSSFAYRESQDVKRIAQALGVDYVLKGSLRRIDDRVRINTHLISAADGSYLWTDRFDRNIDDILNIQDQITRHIVASLSIELTEPEWQRLSRQRTVSPDAYDMFLRGLHPFSQFTAHGVSTGREFFEKSIELDPGYARAYANIALSYGREIVFQIVNFDQEALRLGLQHAYRAMELDPGIPQTQFALAVLYLANRDHDAALAAARHAVELDVNYADGFAVLAQVLCYRGELDEALDMIRHAKTLNPIVPFTYDWVEGHILYHQKRYHDALTLLAQSYDSNPSFYLGLLKLAATYGQLGDQDEAEWLKAEILTMNPTMRATDVVQNTPYRLAPLQEHLKVGLLKAGLPD